MSNGFSRAEHAVVPGTLRGYRSWYIESSYVDKLALRALNFMYNWKPGINRAECLRSSSYPIYYAAPDWAKDSDWNHEVPHRGCTCGFYALHDITTIHNQPYPTGPVLGSIKGSGRVILGDTGFKAQYAEIEALVLPSLASVRRTLGNIYQVPLYTNVEEFLNDYPPISVKELLPPPIPPRTMAMEWTLNEEQIEQLKELLGLANTKIEREPEG